MATTFHRRSTFTILLIVMPFRFLSGRPMGGNAVTDARFFYRATKSLHPSGRSTRWAMLAGWHRAILRLVALAAVLGTAWAYAYHRDSFLTAVMWIRRVGVVCLVLMLFVYIRRYRMRTEVIEPLADALRPILSLDASVPASRVVSVPRFAVAIPQTRLMQRYSATRFHAYVKRGVEWLTDGREPVERVRSWGISAHERFLVRNSNTHPVRIPLPPTWPGAKPELIATAASRLGGDWAATWKLRGSRPCVEMRVMPVPPAVAMWTRYVPAVELSNSTELMIGATVGMRPVRIDLDIDAPHIALSMGTGAGKSVVARLLASQALRKGWAVVIIDLKQESHPWAKELMDNGVKGITYARKPAQAHETLLALDRERGSRQDQRWEDKTLQFQRVFIIIEEMNLTANELRAYWQTIKPKGAPGKSPAVAAMANLTFVGRSLGLHCLAIGQMLSAQVFGDPAARENFGARFLGRYTANNWKMLVPEITPMPRSSKIRGRIQVCIAGEATPTQVLYMSDDEAMEYASGGIDAGNPPDVIPFRLPDVDSTARPVDPAVTSAYAVDMSTAGHPVLTLVRNPDEPRYTLSEAVREGILPGKYKTVQKAFSRDKAMGKTPEGIDIDGQITYAETELRKWQVSRPIAGRRENEA